MPYATIFSSHATMIVRLIPLPHCHMQSAECLLVYCCLLYGQAGARFDRDGTSSITTYIRVRYIYQTLLTLSCHQLLQISHETS